MKNEEKTGLKIYGKFSLHRLKENNFENNFSILTLWRH